MLQTTSFRGINTNFILYNSQNTDIKKREKLLGYLPGRPEWAYSKFCEALKEDGQEHIVSSYLQLSVEGLRTDGL